MQNINLKIFELLVDETTLNIGFRIRGAFNPRVRKPIITAVFDDGVENRRMPVMIQAYYPNEALSEYTIFAGYKYNIEHLFFHTNMPENVKISIELAYGDEVYTDIKYKYSKDFMATGSVYYDINIAKNNSHIELSCREEVLNEKQSRFISAIQNFFGFLWKIVLFLLSLCLLPFFCIEGVLALLGCVDNAPRNSNTGIMRFIFHVRWRTNFILRHYLGFGDMKIKLALLSFNMFKHFKPKNNRVTFISNRRDNISGNYEYIYDKLIKNKNLDIRCVLDTNEGYLSCFKYGYYLATSKVVLVDDFVKTIYSVPRRSDNYLIQVWHACGAFKTFGFSRLGKPGGQKQGSYAHRNYDYCTVSSKEICKFYAEGFGLSLEKVVATGVPRTDIFFSSRYKEKVRADFYDKYPHLKNKKIILFAPTFRGNGKKTGYYPQERFDFVKLFEKLNGEYAIIIKHHPFVNNKVEIPEKYLNDIIDMSENEELNDLLFVTDILITDYSSVVFEASLLDIPMLLYAFDLQSYISTRGFYYEYDDLVPGKIVSNMSQLEEAIENNDFEEYKIEGFKKRFFDELDGRAGYRVASLIEDLTHK